LGVFTAILADSREAVRLAVDERSGLRTIIALHDTTLGPALGGTDFSPQVDRDVLAPGDPATAVLHCPRRRLEGIGSLRSMHETEVG